MSEMHKPEFKKQTQPLVVDAAQELNWPEGSLADLAIALFLAALAILWARPFETLLVDRDEGILLQGAVRIMQGQVPYRDFFSFYTPGGYYLYALVFKILGTTLVAARSVLLVYAGMFAALTFLLSRRACSRVAALFSSAVLSIVCLPSRFAVLHNWDSTMTALLALYCAVLFIQRPASSSVFFCGLFAGATLMIEQSKGAGLLLGLAIASVLLFKPKRDTSYRSQFAAAIAGIILPVLVVLVYFGMEHGLTEMFAAWFWPFTHYSGANRLSYGHLPWSDVLGTLKSAAAVELGVYLVIFLAPLVISLIPIVVFATAAYVAVQSFSTRKEVTPLERFVILVGSVNFGVWLSTLATGRPDFYHLLMLAPLFFFFIPLLGDRRVIDLPGISRAQPLVAVLILISFSAYALAFRSLPAAEQQSLQTPRGNVRISREDEIPPYLQAHVAPGQRVLMYPYNPLLSFLSGTMSPTRFDFLQVGMHSPAQFETARRELAQDNTAAVVFDLTFPELITENWPATPATAVAKDPVADFIFQRYRVCKVLRNRRGLPSAYMVRKDLPCPGN